MLTEPCEETLKITLLMGDFHKHAGAKMITFGDWEVPAYYTTIIEEHRCVREKAGIFDVSHMGEIVISGSDARAFLQYVLTNDIDNYDYGTAFYSLLCNERGGIVDDVFVYPVTEGQYFLIVNASNIEKDHAWLCAHNAFSDAHIENVSERRAMIACQGPRSNEIVSRVFECDAQVIGFHKFIEMPYGGDKAVISASGYTGERGFEIMFDNDLGHTIWNALLKAGEQYGLQPIGFGARDTLRIEAGCPLYGHELTDDISPFEVRCGWVVKLEKARDFIGKDSLVKAKDRGVQRKLFGLEMIERSVPRENYEVFKNDERVGQITSGSYLPSVDKNAAMALLNATQVTSGDTVEVLIRSRRYKALVTNLPFYKAQR